MDAHLLHAASKSLETVVGSRISKIYQYDSDIYVFSLYGNAKKNFLTVRTGKNIPFLFLSDTHQARGETPPASVMRLRKYLVGKRIINMYCAWWSRVVFFQVAAEEGKNYWFKIDLKNGVNLTSEDPFTAYPKPYLEEFENLDEILSLLNPTNKNFSPYFTPALRKTFQAIIEEESDENDAFLEIKSLLIDLESAEGDLFLYTSSSNNENKSEKEEKKELFAWQLPKKLQEDKIEEVYDNALYALNEFGKTQVLTHLSQDIRKNASKPHIARIKKIKNLRDKLVEEENRLKSMLDKREIALKLQAHLYSLDKDSKKESILIDNEEITLNQKLTIKENMENLFHLAQRGKRGLIYLVKRRQEVEAELEEAKQKLIESQALSAVPKNVTLTSSKIKENKNNQKDSSKSSNELHLPKQVLLRKSKDGFTILLGKDVKGNKLVLKLAAPNDYWLHTADGASAHAIIKRDHNAIVVPEATFEEAGRLVAEKSPFKYDEKALIQYSLAKNIQSMKNAGPGMVRIIKSEGSFWVSLDEQE